MGVAAEKTGSNRAADFKLDEVVRLKGHYFKIVLIDGFTGKIAMKWISADEARLLGAPAPDSAAGTSGTAK